MTLKMGPVQGTRAGIQFGRASGRCRWLWFRNIDPWTQGVVAMRKPAPDWPRTGINNLSVGSDVDTKQPARKEPNQQNPG